MSPGFFLRAAARELRGSGARVAFFVGCLAVGVAAVVSVASLSASLEKAIRSQARQLLAADLRLSGQQPLPASTTEILASWRAETRAENGVETVEIREMVTVVAAAAGDAGRSQLVELKAVAGPYPFFGDLELAPALPLGELLTSESAVVAPDLLARLGLAVGERLRVGNAELTITGTVASEPDRLAFTFSLGPRVFLSMAALERTGLEQFGSRITYRTLIRLPELSSKEELDLRAEALRESLRGQGYASVETYAEAQPALRRGLRQLERYLGLVALLSLLIGGIGVAQTVRAWLATRLDAIAILGCLGLAPRETLALYLGQTAALGAAGSLIGALLGSFLPMVVPRLLGGLIPLDAVDLYQPAAVLRGFALGLGVALLFSLPPLLTVRRVPPVRVFRHSAEPLPPGRATWAVLIAVTLAGVALLAGAQAGSPGLGLAFTGGLATLTGALALAATAAARLARRPRSTSFGGLGLRHGLAALGRPGAGTVGAIVALGLGVMVVLAMFLVESLLARQLATDLPEDSPSGFLVDVQPDQWPGVQDLLQETGARDVESVPVVMARLAEIDGTPVQELAPALRGAEESREERAEELDDDERRAGASRWALTREQRLSYMGTLPEDNRILETSGSQDLGLSPWSEPELAEVSVEEEFARDLGVGVGSRLLFDIQGVPLELAVTSLRSVDWGTFDINFYLVVEPGVLEEAPQWRLATFRLPPEKIQPFQDRLAAAFPNVTVIRIREILEKIVGVLDRLGFAVRFLGGFTVVAGLVILGGAVSAGAARRGREVALLKTLGQTRAGVAAAFAVEYALVGLVAGVIGTVGAAVLAWAVVTHGLEVPWHLQPLAYLSAVAASILLTVLAGLATSASALRSRPVAVLRQE